jgi:FKBP-type peptidyl-prolyl cis-trans isomerase
MKKLACIALVSLSLLALSAQTDVKETSYAFGVFLGESLKQTTLDIDIDSFTRGITDVLVKGSPTMTANEAQNAIQKALQAVAQKMSDDNLRKGTEFLAANGKKPGVVTTSSGLQYKVTKEGTGASPKATDTVKVHYVGTLLDGTTFDSSVARGTPAEFPLNRVIPGWTEGLQFMKVGGKTTFYIPSSLAYGANGSGDSIGPNETLVFDVELLSITNPAQ